MSKSTTPTQATVDENVGPNENKTLGPKNFDKQAIVARGAANSAEVAPEAATSGLSQPARPLD